MVLARLFGLGRLHPAQRVVVLWLAVAIAVGIRVASPAGQRHFGAELSSGTDLNVVATMVGDGSSARPARPRWLVAVFFGLRLPPLRMGSPAPPAARPPGGGWTAADIRSALRREYVAVRIAIIVLTVVALVDGA